MMFPKRQPMTGLSSNFKARETTNAHTDWYQRVRPHDVIVAALRLGDIGRSVRSRQRSQVWIPKLRLPGALGFGAGAMGQENNDRRWPDHGVQRGEPAR